jgi:hypothetical protein
MQNPDFAHGHFVPNKMEVNLHVLGALVLYWVRGEVYCTDIVAEDDSSFARWATKFCQ